MPARRAQRKVPGGKLVRIDALCVDGVLTEVRISGDFFVHPEEALTVVERQLNAGRFNGNEEDLAERVGSIVADSGAQLVGFGPNDIAELLRELRC